MLIAFRHSAGVIGSAKLTSHSGRYSLLLLMQMMHLVVAGNILEHHADVEDLVGADAVIKDIETAVSRLSAVIDTSKD